MVILNLGSYNSLDIVLGQLKTTRIGRVKGRSAKEESSAWVVAAIICIHRVYHKIWRATDVRCKVLQQIDGVDATVVPAVIRPAAVPDEINIDGADKHEPTVIFDPALCIGSMIRPLRRRNCGRRGEDRD